MMNRRQFLKLLSAGSFNSLSGCSSFSRRESNTISPESSPSPAETPTISPTEESPGTDSETTDTPWKINPIEHDKLIGAHYYIEYGGDRVGKSTFEDGSWLEFTPGEPLLGGYDSSDTEVINQHVQWAVNHGINWFPCSWHRAGTGYRTDEVLKDAFPRAELIDGIDFSILYESKTNLNFEPSGAIDFDQPGTRLLLKDDFRYFEENYFDRDNYLRVDGRPVIYFWAVNTFTGDIGGAFEEAKASLREDPYLIADVLGGGRNTIHLEWMSEFDAATMYIPVKYWDSTQGFDNFLEEVMDRYQRWSLASEQAEMDFLPTVLPGFDNSHIDWRDPSEYKVLDRSPERFREFCSLALDYLDQDLNAVWVTSFNEWPEYTAIEPAESYGESYLEIVAEELALGNPDYHSPQDYILLEIDFSDTFQPAEHNEQSDDTRELSFRLGNLRFFEDGGELLKDYNVGVSSEEPVFAEGFYETEANENTELGTWRWLGGPTAHTSIFVNKNLTNASTASLFGRPISDSWGELSADIYWQGENTDLVKFDDGLSEYKISLQA